MSGRGAALGVTRRAALAFRLGRHQLTPDAPDRGGDTALLDYGVQDTGTDGAAWALAIRGGPPIDPARHLLAWTLRGAPHVYRRADVDQVASASAPYSEADAASRVFDAAKPLKAAGIPVLDALRVVAREMRALVQAALVKGVVSERLTATLPDAYLRFCRPCNATHVYEMPFRLAALQAGLELRLGTSPPELTPIEGFEAPGYGRLAGETGVDERFDVIRNYLRFYGPATQTAAAKFLDAPAREVKAHWPDDAVEVRVEDEDAVRAPRFVLDADAAALAVPPSPATTALLLGPYDPYLQARDRELLVPDAGRRKELWPVLGRPGVVLHGTEVAGTWRPRARGARLEVVVTAWEPLAPGLRAAVEAEAERLAHHRGVAFAGVTSP